MEPVIDENLTSRQLAILGFEAMKKMASASVFLSGLDGLGVETAKSVALAGVKRLTLHDTKPATWLDMSTQFYIRPSDLGANRAVVGGPRIAELNAYTAVDVKTDDLNTVLDLDAYFQDYNLICLVGAPLALQLRVNAWCRENGRKFIAAQSPGLLGCVFCDFGDAFDTTDPFGTVLKELIVADIRVANERELHVYCDQNQRHDLFDGALVKFAEVQGMTQLNDNEYTVIGLDQYSFKIETDTTSLSPYAKGGTVLEQRGVKQYVFQSLEAQLTCPKFASEVLDFYKADSALLLLAIRALDEYASVHGALPGVWNSQAALEFIEIVQRLNQALKPPVAGQTDWQATAFVEHVDLDLLTKISYTSRGMNE